MPPEAPQYRTIVALRVDGTSYEDATARILRWAGSDRGHYVCVANVHSVMEAHDDPTFRDVLNAADLVTPDGMPLVWGLRVLGVRGATRVYGPELMLRLCEVAGRKSVPVGFLGGTPEALKRLRYQLARRFPGLRVAYTWSPPFRPLEPAEEMAVLRNLEESGARILFVGLGCPKQERWMARCVGRSTVAMVGVGAAFDFIAGIKPQAPAWLQRMGLEWAFRLATEPRRLWRRYAYHNPRFLLLFARQMLLGRRGGGPD